MHQKCKLYLWIGRHGLSILYSHAQNSILLPYLVLSNCLHVKNYCLSVISLIFLMILLFQLFVNKWKSRDRYTIELKGAYTTQFHWLICYLIYILHRKITLFLELKKSNQVQVLVLCYNNRCQNKCNLLCSYYNVNVSFDVIVNWK